MAGIAPSSVAEDAPEEITLRSDEFEDGEMLAQRYTCDGTNTSPPLTWSDVPDGTAEVVLVAENPDHPDGPFVHWMVAGLEPLDLGGIHEGKVPDAAVEGLNDYGAPGYKGPCPPVGDPAHRLVFTVIASGVSLGLGQRFSATDLAGALDGNVLAKGVLVARYGRTELTGPTGEDDPQTVS